MSFIDLNDPMTLAEIALIILAGLVVVWTRYLKKPKKGATSTTQPGLNHRDGTLWQLTRIANSLEIITGASGSSAPTDMVTRVEQLATQLEGLGDSVSPALVAAWIRETVLQQKKVNTGA